MRAEAPLIRSTKKCYRERMRFVQPSRMAIVPSRTSFSSVLAGRDDLIANVAFPMHQIKAARKNLDSMFRAIASVLILLLSLSFSGGAAMARYLDHCGVQGEASEAKIMVGHAMSETLHAPGRNDHTQHMPTEPDLADSRDQGCNQHLCSINVDLVSIPAKLCVFNATMDGPDETSFAGLNRPESLYRPPDV